MHFHQWKRREFITLLGGAAAWPLAARAQQPAMPIVGFVDGRSAEASVRQAAAFRKGLNETGYVEGQNLMVEYHWLEGQYNRLPALMADLVRRRVAVIATPGDPTTLAASALRRVLVDRLRQLPRKSMATGGVGRTNGFVGRALFSRRLVVRAVAKCTDRARRSGSSAAACAS